VEPGTWMALSVSLCHITLVWEIDLWEAAGGSCWIKLY
jgi:hypothetical protein